MWEKEAEIIEKVLIFPISTCVWQTSSTMDIYVAKYCKSILFDIKRETVKKNQLLYQDALACRKSFQNACFGQLYRRFRVYILFAR